MADTQASLRAGHGMRNAFRDSSGGFRRPEAERMEHSAHPLKVYAFDCSDASQAEFVCEAAEVLGDKQDDIILESSQVGLAVLARSEPALAAPIGALLDHFGGDRLQLSGPHVRYKAGPPLQEPIMTLLVRVPRHLSAAVQCDLTARQAAQVEVEAGAATTVIRAEAPQATLLGYPAWLEEMSCGLGELALRLSRYAPVQSGPDPAPGPSGS